jgi:hypothetical protein
MFRNEVRTLRVRSTFPLAGCAGHGLNVEFAVFGKNVIVHYWTNPIWDALLLYGTCPRYKTCPLWRIFPLWETCPLRYYIHCVEHIFWEKNVYSGGYAHCGIMPTVGLTPSAEDTALLYVGQHTVGGMPTVWDMPNAGRGGGGHVRSKGPVH